MWVSSGLCSRATSLSWFFCGTALFYNGECPIPRTTSVPGKLGWSLMLYLGEAPGFHKGLHCSPQKEKAGKQPLLLQSEQFLFCMFKKAESLPNIWGGWWWWRETLSLWDLHLEFHDLIFFVTRQMALTDQCFLHLAGHSNHLGNFKPTHIPVYHTWRFQLSQNQVESEICIFFFKSLQVTYL